mgnify:FL=1|jgi:Adenosine deaminase
MKLEAEICYRAVEARDARFDGRFFTAVKTTGIFCRPICPAPTPRRRNVEFFPSAAAAAAAGYRPCLRCRPEVAPFSAAWNGTASVVKRALRLIEAGKAHRLPDQLGISERHLRRLFQQHLGASPKEVELMHRVLLAKHLISSTTLPLTEIAFASGFTSVRRFNEAVRKVYRCNPTEIRRSTMAPPSSGIRLKLSYVPPYDWNRFAAFVAPRIIPGLESIEGRIYCRTLRLPEGPARINVEFLPDEHAFGLSLELPKLSSVRDVVERARCFFDLRCDPNAVYRHLRRFLRVSPGLRVPGAWDVFEIAVRAVLGQQVSVKAATTYARRLVDRFNGFPTPEELAAADLSGLGLMPRRCETLKRLADVAAAAENLPPEDFIARLSGIPGIGPWTLQYITLRTGNPDAFPSGDLLLKAYGSAEEWRPWRAYAAMAIWTGGVAR